jgi:glutathione S-transferase
MPHQVNHFLNKFPSYLALRGLSYKRCIQPPILPRPALLALGVHYRRIPVLSIGKDIYCDSRAIIATLEKQFPSNRLGASEPFAQAVEYLLENFINDGGPFWRAAQMIPPSLISPEFAKDRSEMRNIPFQSKGRERERPEAMAHVRMYFDLVEDKLLADGRKFLSGFEEPKLVDVHAAWNLDWATGLASLKQEGETGDLFTQERYPRVWAWLDRYKKFVTGIHKKNGRAVTISVEDAVQKILDSEYAEKEGDVDLVDPLKLQKGQMVEMWPTDSGMNHHDKGKLVSIGANEVCVESEVPGGKGFLRIHW